MSTQPCGCDPEWVNPFGTNGWLCNRHREEHVIERSALIDAPPVDPFIPVSQYEDLQVERAVAFTHDPLSFVGFGGAPTRASILPTVPAERKQYPVASGVLDYFPDALAAVSNVSWRGNEQHNPGQPLHWARGKSADEADTMIRHFLQRGSLDTDGLRHTAKLAWRALALLQKEIEQESK